MSPNAVLGITLGLVSQVLAQAPCTLQPSGTITATQYNAMYSALQAAMQVDATLPGFQQGDFVGGVVRLTFHDAGEIDVTQANDPLGVDGCVDLSLDSNNGLAPIIAQLEILRQPFCGVIGRADFWVLAGKVAVETRATVNGYTVPFRYGRTDAGANGCNGASGRLPAAEGGNEEISRVFETQMGLTFRDATALIGAHTLGRAQTGNSGYNGPWVGGTNPAIFDNQYFVDLFVPWNKNVVSTNPPITQWEINNGNQPRRIFLNADMELAWNVVDEVDSIDRCGGRNGGDCSENTAVSGPAREFQQSNTAWLQQFALSYRRMTEVGIPETSLACVDRKSVV